MAATTRNRRVLIFGAVLLLATGPAAAAFYLVDRFDDSTVGSCAGAVANDCALRGAIIAANGHAGLDVILLPAGTYTLSIGGRGEDLCQTGDLDVRDALIIIGDGPRTTFINADGIDRVLHVLSPGATVTLRGITIAGGAPAGASVATDSGAGVLIASGRLRVESCFVIGNSSTIGEGGAISDRGATASLGPIVLNSFLFGNSAYNCSAIYSGAMLQLEWSTVAGNVASADTAVCVYGDGSLLTNSTIADNQGSDIAGLATSASSVHLTGCTFVGNQGAALFAPAVQPILANTLISGSCGSFTDVVSLGGNLESPGNTCGLESSDLVNVANPMLSGLGWFGGPAPVHRPLPGSPAIDQPLAGPNCPGEDQRGVSRPRDGGGGPAAVCDVGAVELAAPNEIFFDTFQAGYATGWSDLAQ